MAKKNEYKELKDKLKAQAEDLRANENSQNEDVQASEPVIVDYAQVVNDLVIQEKEEKEVEVPAKVHKSGVVARGVSHNKPIIANNVPQEQKKPNDLAKKNFTGNAKTNTKGTFCMGGKVFRNQ